MRWKLLFLTLLATLSYSVSAQPKPEDIAEAFLGPAADLVALAWMLMLGLGIMGILVVVAYAIGKWKFGRRGRAIDLFFEASIAFIPVPIIYIVINILNTANVNIFPHQKDIALILNGLLERAWSILVKLFTKKASFILGCKP
ncbi:MAG: hypothetical protein DRJ52_08465 [Thermoprotei archaeon]|nr:MAG: hypothetical protein DRJ52_08465 [Thermoprotei archaeon]